VRKYIKAHDGMLLANHGALTVGRDLFGAYYKMETVEHFAKISLVARMLGRENLIAREEVLRLQELRGTTASRRRRRFAPTRRRGRRDPASCQVVQAPAAAARAWLQTRLRARETHARFGVASADGDARNSVNIPRTFRVN
jgi:L-fuculose-phosphate aldolase